MGESYGPGGCNMEDSSYDGSVANGTMSGGLGQLTDNILGEATEIFASSSGSSWLGWSHRRQVELLFEFKEIREFDNCSLHVAHVPRRDVEVNIYIYIYFFQVSLHNINDRIFFFSRFSHRYKHSSRTTASTIKH